MARDFSSPAYQRIAAEWAEKIDRGDYEDQYRLPTREALMHEHGVSMQVVRDALGLLHTAGYVRSEPSRAGGTFVRRPLRIDLGMNAFEADERDQDAFQAVVGDLGHVPTQDIRLETVLGDDAGLPVGLAVSAGDEVLVRRRTRFVDGTPYSISDSFYPKRLVEGSAIAHPADITRGARHVLAEIGLAMHHHDDVIESRRPFNNEVRALGIAPGLAVIAHTRVSYTEDDVPIRLLASVLPSDRWRLTYGVR